MPKKSLFMETTRVGASRTIAEITDELVRAGAHQVSTSYGPDRLISGVSFTLHIDGRLLPFSLPARVEPIFKTINGRRKRDWQRDECADKDRERAVRVAWRQLLRWVQAQLSMIDCGMAEPGEVFMPYVVGLNGKTLWEHMSKSGGLGRLLEAGDQSGKKGAS